MGRLHACGLVTCMHVDGGCLHADGGPARGRGACMWTGGACMWMGGACMQIGDLHVDGGVPARARGAYTPLELWLS